MFVGAHENFEDAESFYDMVDVLIEEFNSFSTKDNNSTEIYLSTIDFYSQLIHAHNYEFPSGYTDMVPLSDDGKRYFNGLFSSRPNFKAFARGAS